MSTSEKLLMQIFERQHSIIDKVKHQIDLFDQELVSKLLIEGITPPSWLIGHNSSESSTTTDRRELRKEDLISKLLLPQQVPVFPYSNAPLYDNKVITATNLEASSNCFSRETNGWNQNTDAQDGLSVMPTVDINDIRCSRSQDGLHQRDPPIVSPKDQMVSSSIDIDTEMDHSLARFNRSRSRQKAFELRSSAKAAAESNLQEIKRSISCSRVNGGSMIASLQLKSVDELKVVKSAEINIESDGGREVTKDEFKSEEHCLDISKTTLSVNYLELSKQRDNSLQTERAFDIDVVIPISDSGNQSVPCQNHVSNFSKNEVNSSSSGKMEKSRSSSRKPLHVLGSELTNPSDTNSKNVEIAEPNVSKCLNKDVPSFDGKEHTEDLTIMERSILARRSFLKDGSAGSSAEGSVDTSGQQRMDNYEVALLEPKEAASAVSNQEVSGSEGFLMEGNSLEDARSMLVERSGDCAIKDTGILLHPEDELASESTENVTSIGRIQCERRSLSKDDHLVGSSDRKFFDMNEETLENCGVTALEAKQALSCLSAASNLPEQDVAVAQGCLIKGASVENTTTMMPDRGEKCTAKGTCTLLSHMDEVANENTCNVTSIERSTHERRSFLEEADSAGSGDRRCPLMKEERVDNCGVSSMEPKQAVSCLSAGSKLHERDVVGSRGCLIDETVVENGSATSLDQSAGCSVQGACVLLHHMGEVALESASNASLIEKSKCKSRSFPEEDASAGSIDRRCSNMNEESADNHGTRLKEPEMEVPYLSAVSDLHEQDISGSQECMIEGSIMEHRSRMMLDKIEECTVEGTYTVLHHVDELQNENFEELTSIERNINGSKCNLKEEGSGGSVDKSCFDMIDSSQTMPVYEGFILESDESQLGIAEGGVIFEELPLPDSSLARASFLEQLCKSAVLNTPMSQFSTAHSVQNTMDLYQSVPNGLLEHMSFKNTSLPCENDGTLLDSSYMEDDLACGFQVRSYSDGPPYARDPLGRNAKKPFASPVRKLWKRRTSNSDSLKKQKSLNPELTCFTIEEDSVICEDSVISEEARKIDEATAIMQENPDSRGMDASFIRKPLADILENSGNPPASFSATQKSYDRGSIDSVSTEVQLTFSQKNMKQKPDNSFNGKGWGTSVAKENKNLSMGENLTRDAELLPNRFSKPKFSEKTRSKREGPNVAQREAKRNNIVSNVSSFVPLVQQKQAAAAVTGKRDIKVKALEAAEAAKRLAEKKENERKMKKDLRQLELKKKQEEQKKKEVELDTRKRVREEEERKENKRKRVEELRKQPREQEKKLRVKNEREARHRPTGDRYEKKEPKNGLEKSKEIDKEIDDNNFREQLESEARLNVILASDDTGERRVPKDCVGINDHMLTIDNANLEAKTNRERSYEISPYQGSDDEDDDDEIRRNKFVPDWASKNNLAQTVASQQHIKADVIFPPSSSANVAEALVPRMR